MNRFEFSTLHSSPFQSYSMDCYFRQSWTDSRLAFSGRKTLALSIEMLRKIWKPDTYIFNGRKSYLHTITTPNKFMRLFPNGKVLYSQRYARNKITKKVPFWISDPTFVISNQLIIVINPIQITISLQNNNKLYTLWLITLRLIQINVIRLTHLWDFFVIFTHYGTHSLL